MKNKIFATLLALPLFIGCVGSIDTNKLPNMNGINIPGMSYINKSDPRGITLKIVDSLKDASKEDCLHHAKIFLGAAEYLKNANGVKQTLTLRGLVSSIQTDYNFPVGKNKAFTDLIEVDMRDYLEIEKPREIDDVLKAKLIETFNLYGESCVKAASSKG